MNKKFSLKSTASFLLKLLVLFLMAFPIIWSLLSSFKTDVEIFRFPPSFFPSPFTFINYQNVFRSNLLLQIGNSIKVSFFTIGLTLFCATLAGYGFSRSSWKFMNLILFFLIGTQMIPGLSNVITLYITGSKLGALNKHWYVVLIYAAANAPTSVWLMKGYFSAIPKSLDEAALVDGCSSFQALTRITLPLVRTGLVACAILVFVNCWNEFLVAMIMLSRTKAKTYSLGLVAFMADNNIKWGNVSAATIVGLIPLLVLFMSFQSSFIEGLTAGAVKS